MIIFYSDKTLFTRIFGVSVISKQSENDHFKVLCVIFEGITKYRGKTAQTDHVWSFVHPKVCHGGVYVIRGNLINPQIGRVPLSGLANMEVSLFWSHKGCHVCCEYIFWNLYQHYIDLFLLLLAVACLDKLVKKGHPNSLFIHCTLSMLWDCPIWELCQIHEMRCHRFADTEKEKTTQTPNYFLSEW